MMKAVRELKVSETEKVPYYYLVDTLCYDMHTNEIVWKSVGTKWLRVLSLGYVSVPLLQLERQCLEIVVEQIETS